MKIIRNITDLKKTIENIPNLGFVPTMGALHKGHVSLIRKSILSRCKRAEEISDRKKALDGDVIITTSGMLNGGPAHWYLNRLRNDQRNAILLTGYQAEDSGGRQLIDESRLTIFGNTVDINLEVEKFTLSNHSGHSAIVEFVHQINPNDVILFHGNRDSGQELLKNELIKSDIKVHQPLNKESNYI